LIQRDFLESNHAQNLQKSVKRALEREALLDDRCEHINRDGNPNLCLHRILRSPIKCLNSQVLFDPAKKQLHLPAALVKRRDGQRRKDKIIGQKSQISLVVPVVESDAAELVGISVVGIEAGEDDCLVADQIRGFIHRPGVQPAGLKIGLSADDEKGFILMDGVEVGEIKIAAVKDIETAGLGDELIQDPDVMNFSSCNLDKRGDRAPQIQKSMELDGGLVFPEDGPGEKRKTKIDRCGVEGINRLLEFEPENIVGIKIASLMDQNLSEIGINAPVASFVGVGQRVPRNVASNSHVIKSIPHRTQTGADVAKAFPESQLSEGHIQELIKTGEAFYLVIAPVSVDAFAEFVKGQEIHDLGENRCGSIHQSLLPGQRSDDNIKSSSNRLWPSTAATYSQCVIWKDLINQRWDPTVNLYFSPHISKRK